VRRLRLMTVAGSVLALACLPAQAQDAKGFFSGNDLWAQCSANDNFRRGVCMGFVTGIADATAGTAAGVPRRMVCIPSQVTLQQTVDVVKGDLAQHPERRHYAAASIVADALAAAFPCKQP
jgi:hypothetical protein